MSEFQYFEFRKIDSRLSKEEMAEIRKLSKRAKITSQCAIFTYSFSDFRSKPEVLLANHFDAFLYVSNFGTKNLSFRIPNRLLQTKALCPYEYKYIVETETCGEHTLINLSFNTDEGGGWIDEEDCADILDNLLPLREALLLGDPRALYLSLLASQNHKRIEPYVQSLDVPPNLNTLSPSLMALVAFLEIDPLLLEKAQSLSLNSADRAFDIDRLSESEKNTFLQKVLDSDPLVTIDLKNCILQKELDRG